MALKDLNKYKDLRNTIRRKGRYPLVGTAVKDTIVIHHSMTKQNAKGSTPQAFANYHIDTQKWPGIAYPFVIAPDGTIFQCDDLDRRTYHAGNTNTRSIGICLIGDFRTEGSKEKPTEAQMMSLYLLVKELQRTLPKLKIIKGHQECPGYSWKNCPGDTWNYKNVVDGSFLKNTNVANKEREDKLMSEIKRDVFVPTTLVGREAVATVLSRFEKKESPLSDAHRKEFLEGAMTQDKAIELIYIAIERGYIEGPRMNDTVKKIDHLETQVKELKK